MKEYYYLQVDVSRDAFEVVVPEKDGYVEHHHIITPNGLYRVTSNEYYDLYTSTENNVGDKLYLIWIVYSYEDELGIEIGLVEYVAVYKNVADAILVVNEFNKKYTNNEKYIDIMLTSGYNERINTGFLVYSFSNFIDIRFKELSVH